MKTLNPPPLFANLVEPPSFLDDIAVATLLVLGAAPTALFVLLVAFGSAPPACSDEPGVTTHAGESRAGQALSPASMI